MKLLEHCCKANAFSLSVELLRGARISEVWQQLRDLAEVHGDLIVVGGERWRA
jgi:hypothetical protein